MVRGSSNEISQYLMFCSLCLPRATVSPWLHHRDLFCSRNTCWIPGDCYQLRTDILVLKHYTFDLYQNCCLKDTAVQNIYNTKQERWSRLVVLLNRRRFRDFHTHLKITTLELLMLFYISFGFLSGLLLTTGGVLYCIPHKWKSTDANQERVCWCFFRAP